MTEKGRT